MPFTFAPYGNPPPFASLLAPLAVALPPRTAYAVWTLLGLAATVAAAATLSRWTGHRHGSRAGRWAVADRGVTDLLSGRPEPAGRRRLPR